MKTEHSAAPAASVFNSVKDVEASLKTRMEKAVSDLQHDMAQVRTGRAYLIDGVVPRGRTGAPRTKGGPSKSED